MSEKTRNGILKPSSIATNCIVAPIHIRTRIEQGCSVRLRTLTHCGGISKVVFRIIFEHPMIQTCSFQILDSTQFHTDGSVGRPQSF